MAAIEWFRLWHDMPNDPKWRTVARTSGQPISLVLSVALHLMVDASRNVTRGHVTVTAEDVASALDVTDDAVEAIFTAMQGRVLDGDLLTGWEKRQPKREDAGNPETGAKSAAERKRAQRERERQAQESGGNGACHGESRDVTLDTDKDTDKEKNQKTVGAGAPGTLDSGSTSDPADAGAGEPAAPAGQAGSAAPAGDGKAAGGEKLPRAMGVRELVAEGVDPRHAEDWLKVRKEKRAPLTQTAWDDVKLEAEKAGITPAEAVRVSATNSWQGFKASWMEKAKGTAPAAARGQPHGGFAQRDYGQGGRL